MTRRALLARLGRVTRSAPLWPLARPWFRRRRPILYYHGVWTGGDPRLRIFGGTELERFEADLALLARCFRLVPLDALLAAGGGDADGGATCALTFDDGFDLAHEGLLEVLRRYRIPATVFVSTRSLDRGELLWQHRFAAIRAERGEAAFCGALNRLLARVGEPRRVERFAEQSRVTRDWPPGRKDEWAAELWRACDMPPTEEFLGAHRPYLDGAGLERWVAAGHSVGCHTASHPFCSRLEEEDLEEEIFAPARHLRDRLPVGPLGPLPFAYPFGDRLPPELEARVVRAGVFSSLLGTAGLSRRDADPSRVERTDAEKGLDLALFGRPLARALRGRMG